MEHLGKTLVVCGIILFLVGVGVWGAADKLSWLGRLPGDINIERPGLHVYIPLTTMLLLSVGLSIAVWLFRRFFR